jgi:hypothetical protein
MHRAFRYLIALPIFVLLACGTSPFDSTTSQGENLVEDTFPNAVDAGGRFTVLDTNITVLQDELGTIINPTEKVHPGLRFLAAGVFRIERSVAYMEFDGGALLEFVERADTLQVDSIRFRFVSSTRDPVDESGSLVLGVSDLKDRFEPFEAENLNTTPLETFTPADSTTDIVLDGEELSTLADRVMDRITTQIDDDDTTFDTSFYLPVFVAPPPEGTPSAFFTINSGAILPQLTVFYTDETQDEEDEQQGDESFAVPYFDFTVTPTIPDASLETMPVSLNGAGAVARFPLDLTPVWQKMNNVDSDMAFANILLATIRIGLDSVVQRLRDSTTISVFENPDSVELLIALRADAEPDTLLYPSRPVIPREDIEGQPFRLEKIDITDLLFSLVEKQPETAYLFLQTRGGIFTEIFWQKPEMLPLSVVFSDPIQRTTDGENAAR